MAVLSIVIPAFNEQGGLPEVLDQIAKLDLDTEVIVVDDGSEDQTSEVAKQHGARVVRHATNLGYGKSLKDGIEAASSDIIAIADADGTYPLEAIPTLLQGLDRGFDMVVGARQGKFYRGSFLRRPARSVLRFLVQFTTGTKIPDINSGLRIFRKRDLADHWHNLSDTFSFTTTLTLTYLLTKRTIQYVPIGYNKRIGRSNIRMIRDSLRTTQYIIQFICRYNPMKLFVLLAALTLILGLAAGHFVGWSLSIFLAGLSTVLVFALGLTVESLRVPR